MLDPSQIEFAVAAEYIACEAFWKRLCQHRWPTIDITQHGNSWKRTFVEKHLVSLLESYYPSRENHNFAKLMREVRAAQPFVQTLEMKKLAISLDIAKTLGDFPNLTALTLRFGSNDVGMDYDKSLFGMQVSGAMSVARLLSNTRTISRLTLKDNLIKGDVMQILSRGLLDNDTLTHLDLSHNPLGDQGARYIAEVLANHPVLMHIDLTNCKIKEAGASALAKGIAEAKCLQSISLSLNQIEDDGGKELLSAIRQHSTLTNVNVSTCGLMNGSVTELLTLLGENTILRRLDLSCNEIGAIDGGLIAEALSNASKSSLIEMDLRATGMNDTSIKKISTIIAKRKAQVKHDQRKAHQAGWDACS